MTRLLALEAISGDKDANYRVRNVSELIGLRICEAPPVSRLIGEPKELARSFR
ncbi:hypothetical protein H9L12_08370 [Sphingomonas rhizophila]|uniref:Uncharacterized protein n=1 Tax=Sphingomonas rhizophila TaxID=2071607 RepID=A0A7G9S921_9SPHN|nr:hypothetical protein [Sphingomonas rhizophila]QNN64346.1 hypothetical protein H9L12_08370 [Sphingomonas rhizophila]